MDTFDGVHQHDDESNWLDLIMWRVLCNQCCVDQQERRGSRAAKRPPATADVELGVVKKRAQVRFGSWKSVSEW